MIVEQRIYQIKPGFMHTFLTAYEAEGLALQSEAFGNLIGYFVAEVGELNRVIQLWGFESFEDRASRRAQLSADPGWREYIAKVGKLVTHQQNEILAPAKFSPIR